MAKNISTQTTVERLAALIHTGYAKKSDLTKAEERVTAAVKAAVAGSLQPAGSVKFATLPALTADNLNKIYNIEDKFTTTEDFKEGAGAHYPAGTNVAIINVGTAEVPEYKYDAYSGVYDFSNFVEKDGSKVLSDENYSTEEKAKLAGIAEGATRVERSETNGKIKINGVEMTVYTPEENLLTEDDIEDYSEEELRQLLGLTAE